MAEQNHLASTEWVDIVNENNEVIAQSAASKCARSACDTGRPISSFMTEWGKFWCSDAPRQKTFIRHAGCHRCGVVQADEQLLESARREAEEELGIAGVPFADHGQFYYEDKFCRVWGSLFSCVSHGRSPCRKKRSARCAG
ncbi:Nudix hydrolase YfcD [Klebsiella pneumoniae]|uniref:Nudix hydrolase YfcD n=1 Tax=Klebsiella pneumoniae TaxID=573 RepID=A0A2X3ESU7_KLEPN|nr:Nudix hydrolase YfcD [Klebsiella pneumoniae]